MMLRILVAAGIAAPWATLAGAADPQLLALVMPDAKILAGVNVDQAKTSPFGLYVLSQIVAQDQHLQQFIAQTGFDPTSNVDEILVAANGTSKTASHLTLARGAFNASQIDAAATAAGAVSEVYKGVTITEDPKRVDGFAFLSGTLAVAGDVASVKAAIDRQSAPTTLPSALSTAVTQLSVTEALDAWGVSEVPPPAFQPPPSAPNIPTNLLQNIQQATGGVKFGQQVAVNAQLVADSAQDANTLATMLQFLVNLAQMQEQQNAQATAALQSVQVTNTGNTVNVTASISEAQLEALVQPKSQPGPDSRRPHRQPQQQRF
jgi:hypothetical protein